MTAPQQELMGYVNKVTEPNTHENKQGYFYCECGPNKPWSYQTVRSLVNAGKIEIRLDKGCDRYTSTHCVVALIPHGWERPEVKAPKLVKIRVTENEEGLTRHWNEAYATAFAGKVLEAEIKDNGDALVDHEWQDGDRTWPGARFCQTNYTVEAPREVKVKFYLHVEKDEVRDSLSEAFPGWSSLSDGAQSQLVGQTLNKIYEVEADLTFEKDGDNYISTDCELTSL